MTNYGPPDPSFITGILQTVREQARKHISKKYVCTSGHLSLFESFGKVFTIRMTGSFRNFGDEMPGIGRKVARTAEGFIAEASEQYVQTVVEKLNVQDSKGVATPGVALSLEEMQCATTLAKDGHALCRVIVGLLLYLLPGRPDIQYSVVQLVVASWRTPG